VNTVLKIIGNPWFAPLVTTVLILAIAPLFIGYMSLVERKVLADFQSRYGPMRVGPRGLLQPLADALKFLLKEDIVPAGADKPLFLLAPIFSVAAALIGLTVVPFAASAFVADVNVAVLLIASVSGLSVLGIILGGWASNSHYPLIGALRSAAQLVSYEVALTLALMTGVMVAGTLSLRDAVAMQQTRHVWFLFSNYGAMIVPFAVFLIASIVETNRSPFDLPEAESELVAGYHTEFSGFRFALYMLAEWVNILVLAALAITIFLGGWLRPLPSIQVLAFPFDVLLPAVVFVGLALYCLKLARESFWGYEKSILIVLAGTFILAGMLFFITLLRPLLSGLFWFFLKLSLFIYLFIWLRATLPRLRYDQLMRFGWKWLIPIGLGGLALNAVLGLIL
jgi:NADH-quinone oxidoreductase subunit H